ncbi:MAG: hypothetical protein HOK61_05060 [Alphaproteobacteria bacterium]|nr:hypothetical protein [Alphaproteobacteria bacterium]
MLFRNATLRRQSRWGDVKAGSGWRFFRESVEIGFKARDKYSVSLMLDHISKADIHSRNKGFDNVGLRQLVGLC